MAFIYSTLSCDQKYSIEGGEVFIAGQANIATKNLITPRGRVTEVDNSLISKLQGNHVFKMHLENGFIAVSSAKADPDKVAKDMQPKDESAPLEEKDTKKDAELAKDKKSKK